MGSYETLRAFVLENFYVEDPSALRGDSSLFDEGIIDSTGVLELVSFLERVFEIRVEDGEIVSGNFDSLDHIIAFVERKRSSSLPRAV